MADLKISALPASTVPLGGTEVLPIVQSSATKQVTVANLTAGRSVGGASFVPSSSTIPANGLYLPTTNAVGLSTNSANAIYISSSQNVGINTVPSYKLVVSASDATNTQGSSVAAVHVINTNADAFGRVSELVFNVNTENIKLAGIAGIYTGFSGGPAGALTFSTSTGTTYPEAMRINSVGNVGIGTTAPSASAILDAQSTTKGVRMPNMTTTQKNAIASPAAGLMVFDTTLAKLCVYSGSAWQTVTSI